MSVHPKQLSERDAGLGTLASSVLRRAPSLQSPGRVSSACPLAIRIVSVQGGLWSQLSLLTVILGVLPPNAADVRFPTKMMALLFAMFLCASSTCHGSTYNFNNPLAISSGGRIPPLNLGCKSKMLRINAMRRTGFPRVSGNDSKSLHSPGLN